MKKTMLYLIATLLCSCGNTVQENTASADSSMHMAHDTAAHPDFSRVTFASRRDTTCRMPLSAGIADTAIVEGKVYGFCSKECKDEFVKTLSAKAHH